MMTLDQLNSNVQVLVGNGEIDKAVAQMEFWITGHGLKDIPISSGNLDFMPLQSIVEVDGRQWTKGYWEHDTKMTCWYSREGEPEVYTKAKNLVFFAKSVRLIRWGSSVNL